MLTQATAFMHHLSHLFQNHGFPKTLDATFNYTWKSNQTLLELLVKNGQLDTYSDIMQLAELLLEQRNATLPQLQQYLSQLPTDQTKYCRRPLADHDAVTIMTIHMSKGLEFPIVFTLGLINRYTARQDYIRHKKKWHLFDPDHAPCKSALQAQESEKMRQLYVALTRAKKRLYVPLLFDTTKKAPAQGTASPLELFLETLPAIDATHTYLKPDHPPALSKQTPLLHPPLPIHFNFPVHHIQSFSSLSKHKPSPSPEIAPEELPKGTETGILLHALLEKVIREKLTHPYQANSIQTLVQKNYSGHTLQFPSSNDYKPD